MLGLLLAALSAFMVFARNYRKCPPNKVLVVYGRKNKEGQGFRLITGGSALVLPLLESFTEIGLENFSVEAQVLKAPNFDGVAVNVDATANVKVSSDPKLLSKAVERMLGKQPAEIKAMLKVTLDGLLRQIIGTLTIEEMVKDREKLAQGVLNNALTELNKLGFDIDNFVINKLWDDEGYIDAMGAKRTAEVQRDAAISKAEAEREALVKSSAARQEGETAKLGADERVAQANRDLAIKTAGFKKETETAQAEADMAGDLKRAEIDKGLRRLKVEAEETETTARIGLAQKEGERMEQELVATVIKPAEAQRQADIIKAEGVKQASIIKADGDATAAVKQAEATVANAKASREKLVQEGEGKATADAAQQRESGLAAALVAQKTGEAEAASSRARGEAEAAVTAAKGDAEGRAILARLVAEAEGLLKKNDAMDKMSDGAKLILLLDRLPMIIEHTGEAGQKMIAAAFDPIGAGISRIDSIHMLDMGNGGANGAGEDPVSRFMSTLPRTVFGVVAQAKALGIDIDSVLEKLGVPKGSLTGLLSNLNLGASNTTVAEEKK